MSYAMLIPFKDGMPTHGVKFQNAWGGATRIWDSLFERHVPKKHKYDSWLCGEKGDRRPWDLAKNESVPMFARAVHAFTFDRFYVRSEHFVRLAEDIDLFDAAYPVSGQANHLPEWSAWMLANVRNFEAVGLHATSVSSNQWHRQRTCECCGQTMDETEGIPLSEGHEVYDVLTGGKL